jgi:3-dehydroquinate synthetase
MSRLGNYKPQFNKVHIIQFENSLKTLCGRTLRKGMSCVLVKYQFVSDEQMCKDCLKYNKTKQSQGEKNE